MLLDAACSVKVAPKLCMVALELQEVYMHGIYNRANKLMYTYILICRVVCRARIVFFPHPLQYNLQSTSSINNVFSTVAAAGPAVVSIGHSLSCMEPSELQTIQSHVKKVVPELDSRGIIEYTFLLAGALKV